MKRYFIKVWSGNNSQNSPIYEYIDINELLKWVTDDENRNLKYSIYEGTCIVDKS